MIKNQSDVAWKEILDAYFNDFVAYCLPELYELIDWTKHWNSLDKELQAITKGTDAGKRLLDKLFKVFLKNGSEQWILVHLEVQGKQDDAFPKRMFTYGYRIFDRYQKPIVSCAILTDDVKKWRPTSYRIGMAGSFLRADFLVVKIIDYKNKIKELELSRNPFACVILSQLAALDIRRKPEDERKKVKFSLTKRLYNKGFKKAEVVNLYKFIDWLIGLSRPFELEYMQDIYEFEEATKMPYISNAEKFGIEKGKMEVARHLLEEGAKLDMVVRVTGFSPAKIKKLQREIKDTAKKNKH